jgi:3-hydroxymyristoyl/3-hydroxydecanoyl-(acyl carrier protein) dehydratase
MVEMIAQAGGVLLLADPSYEVSHHIMMLTAIEKASFCGDINPGVTLNVSARLLNLRSNAARLTGKVSLARTQLCSATIMCQFIDVSELR